MRERKTAVLEKGQNLSLRKRTKLLGVNLSSLYVKKTRNENTDEAIIMNEIRDIYERHPFKGYRRVTLDLKDLGFDINRKRVYRLMKAMGLMAIYPKMNLSKRRQEGKVHRYLLKSCPPLKPHDVWCVDITYIKIKTGFLYLTALIDVVSRHIMGYKVSTNLDTESCLYALEMALKRGYMPKIINSDQGCQFTSQEWLYSLSLLGIKISMDGKSRCLDNISIERFWRTLKYEEVYLKTYDTVKEAKKELGNYIDWYNNHRRHSGLEYHKPIEVMTGLKRVLTWSFQQADGYVDNCMQLPHIPTASTTTNKQHIKGNNKMILSSTFAA